MTGQQLLEELQKLTPEQLERQVWVQENARSYPLTEISLTRHIFPLIELG